jgi:hypothetical protein
LFERLESILQNLALNMIPKEFVVVGASALLGTLSVSTAVLRAVCEELRVGIGDVLVWERPQPKLHRIDPEIQDRLSLLMTKNNEDELTGEERKELETLGAEAERLSLENARILAAAAKGRDTGKLRPRSSTRAATRSPSPRAKTATGKAAH